MPRLYNWIRGEGTTKAQRWGLNGMGLGLNCPGDPGCPGYVVPGSTDYVTSLQNELASLYDSIVNPGVTPALTPTGVNFFTNADGTTNWLVIGAIGLGVYLIAKRR
jgi:hypothetical protein